MNNDKLRKLVDDLVELAGGYNPRGLLIVVLSGLALGFLVGGFLAMRFGIFFLLLPVVAGLAAGGVVAYQKFQGNGGFANVRRQGDPTQNTVASSPSGAPRQPSPAPPPPTQTPVPASAQLSELEQQVMDWVVQANGNISVSALANELGVTADLARRTIEDLIGRGVITLG